jgi:hypothetical protein
LLPALPFTQRRPSGYLLPLKAKHEAAAKGESSTASVESHFIPLKPALALMDLDLGLLIGIASAGLSVSAVGGDSDNTDNRNNAFLKDFMRSPTSAASSVCPRMTDMPRAHGKEPKDYFLLPSVLQ